VSFTLSVQPLLHALQHHFGFTDFRAGQSDIIQAICAQRDCLVLMPTGAGKSLCYQLPAAILPGITLVVSPLIALMKDQVDALNRQGIKAAFVNSSLDATAIQQIFQQVGNGEIKLLYVAPERLLQHHFLHGLASLPISFFAIDEAHCISQWGHDFRPAYTQLAILKQQFPHIPIMALTATADVTTRKDILEQLALQNPYIHLDSFDRPNIRLTLAEKYQGTQQVIRYIKRRANECGIIYCNSRWQVEKLTQSLLDQQINCAAYHAGLPVEERNRVQENFTKDNIQVVVATVAFGLGINKPNIRYVIHFECPRTLESYYQEIGRAGRDGLPAEALFLFDHKDVERVQKRIEQGENEQRVAVEKQRFQAMVGFAEAQTCRRQVLLNYFAEYVDKKCGNCDICLDPPTTFDGLIPAKQVLSCVYRVQQQGDINYIVQVLRGEKTPTIIEKQHHLVSTFGLGKQNPPSYWFAIIRQLIHLGYLQQDIADNSALKLTLAAREVLKQQQPLMLATPRLQQASYWKRETTPPTTDRILFHKLRELRKVLADAEDIAPYIIFNDATLQQLAQKRPTTPQQMLAISGIGDVKLARYGQAFLHCIEEHLQQSSIR
jgi:ATP-dependent DNA helicase RecQ